MGIALITGSAGLIGSEAVKFFHDKGFYIIGIDNDMRKYFFGDIASTNSKRIFLENNYKNYQHVNIDIRDYDKLKIVFEEANKYIDIVIHTAAQPSHDWAAKEPITDFTVNANGTMNMLELTRLYSPDATFIYTSTNKVYGDTPNYLPLVELETRWELDPSHPYAKLGIDETMSIDNSKHSIFGASKLAADIMVQEYGKYFNMKTSVYRGGCLTGPAHCGAELHGFLSYLIKCAVNKKHYTIFGYKGKQVRDNIHSYDLVNAFWHYHQNPRCGEVYNMGGSRHSNISMLEAINKIENILGYKMDYTLTDNSRIGDHIWYVSDVSKFQNHYPDWKYEYDIDCVINEMINAAKNDLNNI